MDTTYREDVVTVLDALLLDMPGVKRGKAFGYPAYKVDGRVFAFVRRDVGIKLPASRVTDLLGSGDVDMQIFQPAEGTVWKEWVSIRRGDAESYRGDVALFEESVQFVGGK